MQNKTVIQTSSPDSPKVKQFMDEFNELLERYQYQLVPTLSYQKTAIIPVINILDIVPEKPVKTEPKKEPKKVVKKEEPKNEPK